MTTIIRDRDLIAILKGANALAREIIERHPHLFGEQAAQQPAPAAPVPQAVRAAGEEEKAA